MQRKKRVLSEIWMIVLHLQPDICAVFIYFLLFVWFGEQDDATFDQLEQWFQVDM